MQMATQRSTIPFPSNTGKENGKPAKASFHFSKMPEEQTEKQPTQRLMPRTSPRQRKKGKPPETSFSFSDGHQNAKGNATEHHPSPEHHPMPKQHRKRKWQTGQGIISFYKDAGRANGKAANATHDAQEPRKTKEKRQTTQDIISILHRHPKCKRRRNGAPPQPQATPEKKMANRPRHHFIFQRCQKGKRQSSQRTA